MARAAVLARIVAVLVSTAVFGSLSYPADGRDLDRRAEQAMAAGDYEKAARLLEDSLRERPGDPRTLYNLACALSRTGDLPKAGESLDAAWQAGLRDVALLRNDPDLDALRASKRGGALIARLVAEEERRARLRGTPRFFEAPTLGTLRVVPPPRVEPGRTYPLIVMLHGHGADPANYAGFFESAGAELDAIVVAPYGPHHVIHQRGHGYSWYPEPWLWREVLSAASEDREPESRRAEIDERERRAALRYALAAIDAVSDAYPVDPARVFVLGHSEGGNVAYGLGLEHPERFRGVIVVGARLRAADATPENLAAAAGKLSVLVCHSRQDEQVPFEHARVAHETLTEAGIDSRISAYTGGHGMTKPLARAIDRWIRGL